MQPCRGQWDAFMWWEVTLLHSRTDALSFSAPLCLPKASVLGVLLAPCQWQPVTGHICTVTKMLGLPALIFPCVRSPAERDRQKDSAQSHTPSSFAFTKGPRFLSIFS